MFASCATLTTARHKNLLSPIREFFAAHKGGGRRVLDEEISVEDVVVIGGGPAGAACTLWLHQLGLKVLLLEAGHAIGGLQLRSPYVNRWLPGVVNQTGKDVAASLQQHLSAAGAPYRLDYRIDRIGKTHPRGVFELWRGREVVRAGHVVLATGARPRTGGFTECDSVAIGPGMPMERQSVAGRRVAILGGGDNAFDQAVFVQGRGASLVDIYCRNPPRALPLLRRGVDAGRVHVGPFDADPSRMSVNGIPYDFFGVQFGFEACIPPGLPLQLHQGSVVVDPQGAVPGVPRLYAAGEVTGFWHPCVVTSYAQGIQVAKSIQQRLDAGMASQPLPVPERPVESAVPG